MTGSSSVQTVASCLTGGFGLAWIGSERIFWGIGAADRPAMLLFLLSAVLGVQLLAIGLVGETLIFTCAGAAYSGQVANRAGVSLAQDGAGKLFCIAAVAADRPEKMERARHAGRRVAIDGCEDDCCRRIMEKAGLSVDLHVDVTKQGIEKQPAEPRLVQHAKRVAEHVTQALGASGR